MEILPGVHELELNGSKAHLLVGEHLTLIDSGLRGSRVKLESQLAALGWSIEDIEVIVVTHGHPDHVGGVPEIATVGGTVMMHPADLATARGGWSDFARHPGRGRFFASMIPPPPTDTEPVGEGRIIDALGGLVVVEAPGHTPGSICLYAPATRTLFTGDALQVGRGRLGLPHRLYTEDMATARRTIARLAELEVDTIVFSHYPAWHGGGGAALRDLAGRI